MRSILLALILLVSVAVPVSAAPADQQPAGTCEIVWYSGPYGNQLGIHVGETMQECLGRMALLTDPYTGPVGSPIGTCALTWVGNKNGRGAGRFFDSTIYGCYQIH